MARNNDVTVVFVHGGFVDGAGWEGVYKIMKKDGYDISIVQNSTLTLADDVAATKRVLAAQDRDVLLVGHSYGGAVITEAGNDPKVVGLVYIAAFAPDKGESVSTLIKDPPPGERRPRLPRADDDGVERRHGATIPIVNTAPASATASSISAAG